MRRRFSVFGLWRPQEGCGPASVPDAELDCLVMFRQP
jgi:hypothetical protein